MSRDQVRLFGNSWENFDHAPAAGMQALADMGLSFIRLWIFWNSANPEPDLYDWSKVDADIEAIRGAGMKVYANLLWAPRHASGGWPTYLPYTQGCTAWNDPSDGSKGIRFAAERGYCTTPAHIDPVATRKFGAELAARHGKSISWYAAWNEPQGQIYWPPIGGEWDAAITRLLDEVTIPFTEGVRSVVPDAVFVGPEADHERVIESVLEQEADRGLHLFDAITFHPYSWGKFPEDSYKRIDEMFVPAALKHRNGRPLWCSEIGDDGTGRIVEWTDSAVERDVAAINFHDFRQWFQPGTWENGTYVPNARYGEMKDLIRRRAGMEPRRRRAARSGGPPSGGNEPPPPEVIRAEKERLRSELHTRLTGGRSMRSAAQVARLVLFEKATFHKGGADTVLALIDEIDSRTAE